LKEDPCSPLHFSLPNMAMYQPTTTTSDNSTPLHCGSIQQQRLQYSSGCRPHTAYSIATTSNHPTSEKAIYCSPPYQDQPCTSLTATRCDLRVSRRVIVSITWNIKHSSGPVASSLLYLFVIVPIQGTSKAGSIPRFRFLIDRQRSGFGI
jgi:hypothetical protein